MDPINLLKFQATHKYKKNNQPLSLSNLFLYFLTALACSMFCLSPLWLPSFSSSMKVFLFVSVPKISSLFMSSKFVFILGNIIVVALIGESKIFSAGSSPSNVVDQYESMKRCQTLHSSSTHQQKVPENLNTLFVEEKEMKKSCGNEEAIEGKGWNHEESKEIVEEVKEDEDEDEINLPDEDQKLNQRADDFIARVNERRRFELLL